MNTEKILKELRIKNDINKLSYKELMDKYGKSDERAAYFIHMFRDIFCDHVYYPTMIFEEYDKLKKVINELHDTRTLPEEIEEDYKYIFKSFEREHAIAPNSDIQNENKSQLAYLRETQMGIYKLNNRPKKFENIVSLMERKTEELDQYYKKNSFFPEKEGYAHLLEDANIIGLNVHPMKEIEMIDKYREMFPLVNLVHDNEALININGLLTEGSFEGKEELAELALNVIDFSLDFHPVNNKNTFNKKDYKKIAKGTVKLYKEIQRKKKEHEKGIQKSLKRQ